ncbi:hypothetical protein ACFX13_021116 [Malus domestica]|uniref:NmrA-like domain-containing protein n=1 Tax=Malus domestica TaxID=3750 RepID=A0A498HF54_MALDO|nr:leucoanthocyanidin reductase-like [Malus domestica]XP_050131004.1 leucoanthocyanidin reductase-like [Malus sylvestris]RXH70108.1 hypothetical protein DVH24_007364 [Malus domestica]
MTVSSSLSVAKSGSVLIVGATGFIEAIGEVGTVKRFLPSEFRHEVDRADPVEPGLTMYLEKRKVRRWVEESGVP